MHAKVIDTARKSIEIIIAMRKTLVTFLLLTLFSLGASAQMINNENTHARVALSTNAVDWAWFITPNITAQFAVSQHVTIEASARYNNWSFMNDSPTDRLRFAQSTYGLGARWWTWYTYSGVWYGAKAQYSEYSRGSFVNRYIKEEGDAAGLSLSAGYSIHINKWFDVDFGLSLWGGKKWYKTYESETNVCPSCGRRTDAAYDQPASTKTFLEPNEAVIALMFVF